MPKTSKSKKDIVNYFCDESSIPLCGLFKQKNLSNFEKVIWTIFSISLIAIVIWLILHMLDDYMIYPTVVTFISSSIPIQTIKHPGISICNINKISKKRARIFAEHLNKNYYNNEGNVTAIMEDIKLLGALYDFRHINRPIKEFQRILEIDYNNSSGPYDPSQHLLNLSTPCKEMLNKCYWGSKQYICEDLFFSRTTYEGNCCVFNYLKPAVTRKSPNVSETPKGSGVEVGLRAVLNNNLDDYFYSGIKTVGFSVHVFYPDDFPDKKSGSLTKIIVGVGLHALINIEIDVIYSSPETRILPIHTRKCNFESEEDTILGTKYRESDCNVECRVKMMASLCKCMPITIPGLIKRKVNAPKCNLLDIPCLIKYKDKWSRYYPYGAETEDSLRKELHDSISCSHCVQSCNSINYRAYTNFAELASTYKAQNITRVDIYFTKPFADLYKMDLTYTWFEVLSSFGGMVAIFIGTSFVSLVEIMVLGVKIMQYYIQNKK